MRAGVVVVASLCVITAGAQQGPPGLTPPTPLRQTFVSAAQVVLDDAQAVNIKADNDHFAGQMQQLKQVSDNLTAMASEDREKDVAAQMKDILFQISSCHIQAIDGTPTDKCEAQVRSAENRAMEILNRHKDGSNWVDGPPGA